jgi:hypothetical protein
MLLFTSMGVGYRAVAPVDYRGEEGEEEEEEGEGEEQEFVPPIEDSPQIRQVLFYCML